MVETESVDPESLSPQLWPLLQLWRERNLMLGRLPHPDEIVPRIKGRWLRHVAMIIPERRDFLVATCGYDLIRRFGRMASGHCVSALASDIREGVAHKLLLAWQSRSPMVWRPEITLGQPPAIRFDELILPLSEDGESVARLLLVAMEGRRPRPKPPPEPQSYEPDWEHD